MELTFDQALTACNCGQVRRAARLLTRFYDAHLQRSGLRSTQFTMLAYLKTHDAVAVGQLADWLIADKATVSHNLKPLERAGYVTMTPDARDRRVRNISLTAAGRKALAACETGWRTAQREFERAYGVREAKALRQMLQRVTEAPLAHTR